MKFFMCGFQYAMCYYVSFLCVLIKSIFFFFLKQKTEYDMRISDWSSDVCSSDRTTDPKVDADDPALWADPSNPARAVMFGTDKSDGLYVHDMHGKVRQFLADGPLNNVDLRSGFVVGGKEYVLVAATERKRFGIMTYLLDPETLATKPYGFIPTGEEFGEPYGFCMGKWGDAFHLVPNNKAGVIRRYRVTAGASGPQVAMTGAFKVGGQPEGCVVDDEAGRLYVGEEDVAIWRFPVDAPDGTRPVQVAAIDGIRLTADVEGLAVMRDRGKTYLIASSQGDATYPVWQEIGRAHV